MGVNTKRGRPAGQDGKLSVEAILSCATKLLQETGRVPSMRKIATALGVDPMALYHYYTNKAELLEAVAVLLMDSIYVPVAGGDWKKELIKLCQSYLELLQTHGGLLETMLGMSSAGPASVFAKRYESILLPLGVPQSIRQDGLDLLADYLHGFALAMRCNPANVKLSIGMSSGPLALCLDVLEAKSSGQ